MSAAARRRRATFSALVVAFVCVTVGAKTGDWSWTVICAAACFYSYAIGLVHGEGDRARIWGEGCWAGKFHGKTQLDNPYRESE